MNIFNTDLPKLYIPVLLSLGFLLALGYGPKTLAEERLYTEASLNGEYAYVAIGEGGPVKVEGSDKLPAGEGAIGVFKLNGSGNGSCETITSVQITAGQPIPGVKSEYSCVEVTYTVRSPNDPADIPGFPQPLPQQNGTGKMTVTLSLVASENPSDIPGTKTTFNADFVIMRAKRINGRLIATEVFFIREKLTEAGNLVTGIFKRRPKSNQKYSNASLQGSYSFASVGRYGATPQARTGIVTYDGKGTGSGFGIANFNSLTGGPADRVVFRGNATDGFEVNKDGTGTFYFDPDKQARYAAIVITQAKKINGQLIATEIFFLNFDSCCQFIPVAQPGFNFTTSVGTRLPD